MRAVSEFSATFTSLWINVSELGFGRRWESQTRTNIMVKSSPSHAEILDEICSTEANHVTIPPLLALTLQPHTPLHRSSSPCSTKSHNCTAHFPPPSVSRPVRPLLEHLPSPTAQQLKNEIVHAHMFGLVPVWYTACGLCMRVHIRLFCPYRCGEVSAPSRLRPSTSSSWW